MKKNYQLKSVLIGCLLLLASCTTKSKEDTAIDTLADLSPEMAQIQGDSILVDGQKYVAMGINIGNWLLLEDFMMGVEGTHSQMKKASVKLWGHEKATHFWKTFEKNYVVEDDIAFLKSLGLNFIRMPFNMNHFSDTKNPSEPSDFFWERVDGLIALCEKHDMKVLFDMHAVPGGQSPSNYGDAETGVTLFWDIPKFRQAATDFWLGIAERYKDKSTVFGYGLLNESNTDGRGDILSDWISTTIATIRKVDKNHIIVISGDDWGKTMMALKDSHFEDPQVMPEIHFYDGMVTNGQRLKEYPTTINGKPLDKSVLKHYLDSVAQPDFGRPVLLGEFGTRWRKHFTTPTTELIKDMIDIISKKGHGWSLWTYKDVGEMGMVSPKDDTAWQQFITKDEVKDLRHIYEEIKKISWKDVSKAGVNHQTMLRLRPYLDDDLLHTKTTILNRIVEGSVSEATFALAADKSMEELEAMAKSFQWDNCTVNPEAEDFVTAIVAITKNNTSN